MRKNDDLTAITGPPTYTDEKFELYRKYVTGWHGRTDVENAAAFESFLYDSPLSTTLEFEYRDPAGRLLAVGICDQCPTALSSVYLYFDPDNAARGLGTFAAMHEIEYSAQLSLSYYYLGYWIEGCGAMEYKQAYKPNEVLHGDGNWRTLDQ